MLQLIWHSDDTRWQGISGAGGTRIYPDNAYRSPVGGGHAEDDDHARVV